MKLYPFIYCSSDALCVIACFESFLKYHGYALDWDYAKLVFRLSKTGVTFRHLLEGLNIFQVVYEIPAATLKSTDLTGLLFKHHGHYALVCGCLGGLVIIMDPRKGYEMILAQHFLEKDHSGCLQLKFLGDFPYESRKRHLSIPLLLAFLPVICYFLILFYIPNYGLLGFVFAGLIDLFLAYHILGAYFYRNDKKYNDEMIDQKVWHQYQQLCLLNSKYYLMVNMLFFFLVYQYHYSKFFNTNILMAVLIWGIIFVLGKKRRHAWRAYYFLVNILFTFFAFSCQLCLTMKSISLEQSLAVLAEGIVIFLGCLCGKLAWLKKTCFQRDYRQWLLEKKIRHDAVEQVDGIGIAGQYYQTNVIIEGSEQALTTFYEQLRSYQLVINERPLVRFDSLLPYSQIMFLEDMLPMKQEITVAEFLNECIEESIILLEQVGHFKDALLFSHPLISLNRQQLELFGFIKLLLEERLFCVIRHAFIYQDVQTSSACIRLLTKKEPKIRMILLVSETKMMNRNDIYDIIRHEKVGCEYERNSF